MFLLLYKDTASTHTHKKNKTGNVLLFYTFQGTTFRASTDFC